MMRVTLSLLLALLMLAAPAVSGAADARSTTHSGTIASIDSAGGVLLLDEVGPWRVEQGRTVLTRRTVVLTPDTKFNIFIRANVPGGFPDDFLEVALDADSVTPGDFATVESVRRRGRLVAVRVTLAEAH
jgi:hypothetical protein